MLSTLLFLFGLHSAVAQESFDPSQCDQISSAMYFLDDPSVGCCPGYTAQNQNGRQICSRGGVSTNNFTQQSAQPPGPSYQLDNLVRQCTDATNDAKSNCDFDENPTVKNVMSLASGMKAQLNQGATSSPAAVCSQMGSLAQAIDAAVAAYSGYCSTGFAKCSDVCDDTLKEAQNMREVAARNPTGSSLSADAIDLKISDIKKKRKECASLAGNIQGVQENITKYAQIESLKKESCGKAVGGQDTNCAANPFSPACQQKLGSANCSDPTFAASNTVCICQRNPNDSRCGGSTGSFSSYSKPGGGGAGGAGVDGKPGDFGGPGGDFPGSAGIDPNLKGNSLQAGANMNKGGGGKAHLDMGGGGTGGPGGRGGGGAGGAGANTKIIGGYGFGNGGGGGYGAGGGYGSGNNGQAGAYGRNGYGIGPNGKPVDLRQFLPGGKMDPSRALAGVSGPDGITGPNTDIWQKIRLRYFSVTPTLLP